MKWNSILADKLEESPTSKELEAFQPGHDIST